MTRPGLDPLALSIFFPCYNEEANVERVTAEALVAAEKITGDYEIIIVNDGSRDRTGELADELAARHERVRAVHNSPNLGYGGALQRGFRAATRDWIFYTDGDGQFDFAELPKLLALLEQYDVASAYRIDRQDPPLRKLNAWAWGLLVRMLFDLPLRDIDCAFKIYPREFVERVELRSMGALIDTEMLARAKRLGYRIGQVGVHHYPRQAGVQTGANIKVIARAFKELFRLRKEILQDAQ